MPTTWNPADKEAHVTLTGSNLIATGTAGWTGSVRATVSQTSGKFYWEYTATTFTQSQTCLGMFGSTVPIASVVSSAQTHTCGLIKGSPNGIVYVDGATTFTVGGVGGSSINFGSIASGTVICVAVDLTAQLIWFRVGAAGNWNNNATYNPATGTGGAAIPNLGGATATYPIAGFGGADQITGNFGDSALTGAVPAGFNNGFPGTAAPTGQSVRVMVLA